MLKPFAKPRLRKTPSFCFLRDRVHFCSVKKIDPIFKAYVQQLQALQVVQPFPKLHSTYLRWQWISWQMHLETRSDFDQQAEHFYVCWNAYMWRNWSERYGEADVMTLVPCEDLHRLLTVSEAKHFWKTCVRFRKQIRKRDLAQTYVWDLHVSQHCFVESPSILFDPPPPAMA